MLKNFQWHAFCENLQQIVSKGFSGRADVWFRSIAYNVSRLFISAVFY